MTPAPAVDLTLTLNLDPVADPSPAPAPAHLHLATCGASADRQLLLEPGTQAAPALQCIQAGTCLLRHGDRRRRALKVGKAPLPPAKRTQKFSWARLTVTECGTASATSP